MMKRVLFYLVLMIFGIAGVAGATFMCQPPVCPEGGDFKIWSAVDDIGASVTDGVSVPFEFNITPYYNPDYDEIHSAWMAFYFKGAADNWFVGKYDFDNDGFQFEIGHTSFYGRALELEQLWGDPLDTLRTTGILSGDFKLLWSECDSLTLKKAYLFAKGCDNPVPEPATLLLLGSGLVAFAGIGRKKIFKKKKKR